MKYFIIFVIIICPKILFSQNRSYVIKGLWGTDYFIESNKIYKEKAGIDSNLIGTLRQQYIYKDSSTNEKDVLFTIQAGKVYKTAVVNAKNLHLYIKNKTIYLRTKAGVFKECGTLGDSNDGEVIAYSLLDRIEYIALLMSTNHIRY